MKVETTAHNHERDADAEARKGGMIEAHSPGGWWGKIEGMNITTILIILAMGLIGAGLYQHSDNEFKSAEKRDRESRDVFLANHKATQTLLGEVIVSQGKLLATVERSQQEAKSMGYVQVYVTTLSQEEKRALKLQMPPELRYGFGK